MENPLAVGPSTLFQISSITKTYTATAIMRLAEAGEVGLDDPARHLRARAPAQGRGGRLIEKVTGQAYEAAIKRLILEPLGCTESFFFAGEVMTRRFAVGHGYKEQQAAVTVARPLLLPRNSAPAGGLFSTARDQIRYARFHLGQAPAEGKARVLARETLDRMKAPTISLQGGALGDWVGWTTPGILRL